MENFIADEVFASFCEKDTQVVKTSKCHLSSTGYQKTDDIGFVVQVAAEISFSLIPKSFPSL